ncbi:MAG: FtsH protease activity modulator HflK [Xanthomonadales bacterium]|nr:FtsH protease activity modulator HflK [Xanthomonadales bacterium]
MAWNEPGNGKNKDPWNSGEQPPDLDEVFRNLQDRLRGIFGGGGGGGGGRKDSGGSGIGWLIGGLIVIWLAFSSVYIIDEPERGVVLRFGEYARTMQPGPNITFPPPIDRVLKVNVEQVRSASKDGSMLTRDENIVHVDMAVQYRVKDAQDFLFEVQAPEETLGQASESALRQVIGDNDMDFVLLEGRAEVAIQIREVLQSILDRYETGLEITALNMQEVRPPREVKDAFDDAIKAREDKERVQNEAEAYANGIVPEARGRSARIIQQAEAYRASLIARAEGEAARFSLLLEEYAAAPRVTRERLYFETIEQVFGKAPKVLIEPSEGSNVMYLPLDELIKATVPAATRTRDELMEHSMTQPGSSSDESIRSPRQSGGRSGREGR